MMAVTLEPGGANVFFTCSLYVPLGEMANELYCCLVFFSASEADAHAHVLQLCRHLLYVFLNRFCKSVKLQQFTILTGNFLSSTVAGEDFERRSVAMETCSHQRPGRAASLDDSLSRYINS